MENKHRNILMVSGILLTFGSGAVVAVGIAAFLIGFISKPQSV